MATRPEAQPSLEVPPNWGADTGPQIERAASFTLLTILCSRFVFRFGSGSSFRGSAVADPDRPEDDEVTGFSLGLSRSA